MLGKSKYLWVVACVWMMAGCASIVSKSTYPVTINSTPEGASFDIVNARTGMKVSSGVTPTQLTLDASEGFFSKASYSITFSKQGYQAVTYPLQAGVDGWYVGNILFGGLIGWLIVDPATGAMWKLDRQVLASMPATPAAPVAEPESELEPEQNQANEMPGEDALTFITLDQVPGELRRFMVPVL